MTASGGRRFAAAQHEYAERHLRRLYDISKLLTRFESIERTLPAILDIAADALPLRTGILVESVAARPRVTVWNVPAADRKEIADAKAKAMSAYAYFTEPVVRDLAAKTVLLAAAGSETGPDDHPFVTIPLVVPEHPAFGVLQMGLLQVGPSAHLDPLDVAFVNAVANQLAVAIDRQRAWERILEQEDIAREEAECRRIEADERRARAELAMKRYAILSESSEALSQFLEREETLTSLARLLVASMAEWCIIDLVRDDGTLHRARVFGADPTRAEIAGRLVGPLDRNVPEPTVMAITEGKAKLWSRVSDADLESFRRKDDPIASVRRLCPGSIIAVPLTIAKRTLGAIALISSEQGRYGEQDVTFAGELAHRAAIALDNADTYARAQHATRRREEVLAVVSHDLRNPVHTMLFGVEALLDLLDPADPAVKLVESLHRAADTMVRLTRDLLDFSSVESGRLSIDLEPAEANPIAREAVEAMKREAVAKSLSVSMELEADDVFIVCDRQRVLQVLSNLIGNAVKFTPAGGSIAVRLDHGAGEVRFSVSDTGTGISPEHLERVFDRYWRDAGAAKPGVGLGLAIAKGLVEAQGGRIWAEAGTDGGTTFSFTLPTAEGAPPVSAEQNSPSSAGVEAKERDGG